MIKRIIAIITILILVNTNLIGQTVIEMEPYGGVYRIPCTVNGARMKFIFDTGASNVCISKAIAEYLLDNGYLTKEDIYGVGHSSVADGSIVDHIKIRLKDVEIQGTHLKDVDAIVIDGQNAPLLMGQSAIQKLGMIEIHGKKLIINNGTPRKRSSHITNNPSDYKYIDTYLNKEHVLTNLRHNAQSYVKFKRWDESKASEFYSALEIFIKAIDAGRLSSDLQGNINDSAGLIDDGTANWRNQYGRVLTEEEFQKLSKRDKAKCTKNFYPNREVALYINTIVKSMFSRSRN